jgi:hypothetical protein
MAVSATRKGMHSGARGKECMAVPATRKGMHGNVSYDERNAWRWQLCGKECMALSATRKGMHDGTSMK